LRPTARQIDKLAAPVVNGADLPRFTELALKEIEGLHEGNIARFRLRPSEFRRWQARYATAHRGVPLQSTARKRKSH
jgi:hypothetical protein